MTDPHPCPFAAGELRALAAIVDVRSPGHALVAKLHDHADQGHASEAPPRDDPVMRGIR